MQPPVKRRRVEVPAVEEISFDNAARQEYLTGFHKRKLQRAKDAREAAERKARLERIGERKKVKSSVLICEITIPNVLDAVTRRAQS